MDFMQQMRPAQPQSPVRPVAAETGESLRSDKGGRRHAEKTDLLSRVTGSGASTLLLVIVALLVAMVVWFIYSSAPASQSRFVNASKLQAVFLNTGQVYFGNIQSLNKDYLTMNNIFYLQSNSSSTDSKNTTATSNSNITLVKLGCELHMPYDQMVVNTSQVTFWENLQSDGQVAKAVANWKQQNPDGQKCSNQPASSTTSNPQTSTKP